MRRILRVKHSLAFPSLSEKRAVETFFMILIVGPDGVQLIQFISSLIGGNKTHVFVLFVCLIFPSVFHENSRKNIRQKSQLVSSQGERLQFELKFFVLLGLLANWLALADLWPTTECTLYLVSSQRAWEETEVGVSQRNQGVMYRFRECETREDQVKVLLDSCTISNSSQKGVGDQRVNCIEEIGWKR